MEITMELIWWGITFLAISEIIYIFLLKNEPKKKREGEWLAVKVISLLLSGFFLLIQGAILFDWNNKIMIYSRLLWEFGILLLWEFGILIMIYSRLVMGIFFRMNRWIMRNL
mgnify:CR=1 FL=1